MKVTPRKQKKSTQAVVRVVFAETIDIPVVRLMDHIVDSDSTWTGSILSEESAMSVISELTDSGDLRSFLWEYEWMGAGEENWEAEVSIIQKD